VSLPPADAPWAECQAMKCLPIEDRIDVCVSIDVKLIYHVAFQLFAFRS
jgi:hypothetical protein